jgi:hypothetical protein
MPEMGAAAARRRRPAATAAAGCIAGGSTSEIDEIAEWTVTHGAASILIE